MTFTNIHAKFLVENADIIQIMIQNQNQIFQIP